MLIENHMLGEIFATRYRGKDPTHAPVISHGFAAHGGIYDAVCSYWTSVFTYDPVVPISENKKPILLVGAEKDPSFPPDLIKAIACGQRVCMSLDRSTTGSCSQFTLMTLCQIE